MRLIGGAIFQVTVPATIIRSAWRGEARKASIPNRAMSKRPIAVAIISKAQQAKPKETGHRADLRPQLTRASTEVTSRFCFRSSGTARDGVSRGAAATARRSLTVLPSSRSRSQVRSCSGPPDCGSSTIFNLSSNEPIPDPACARRRPSPPAGWRRIRPFQSGRTVPSRGTWPPRGTETPPRHRR